MLRKILLTLLALIVIGGVAFVLGPKPQADLMADFNASSLGEDLDAYLAESEAAYSDLRSGMGKEIIWANAITKAKTNIVIVNVHGFSASKEEIRPVPDNVANALDANLYLGRLAGHGRSGDAMAEPTAKDWMNDLAESIAIGERLGEKLILVTVSTGGTLAKAGFANEELMKNVAGIVFISPNFKINNPAAPLLTMPWAKQLVPAISGAERSFEPENEKHAANWTSTYPTRALFPMAALVRDTGKIPASSINVPALFMFDPQDRVVDAETTKQVAADWGGPSQTIEVTDSDDPYHHVIAGDSLSPSTTGSAVDAIVSWAQEL
jgi:alpha-beta hydrolase superfamily lysophospholipase